MASEACAFGRRDHISGNKPFKQKWVNISTTCFNIKIPYILSTDYIDMDPVRFVEQKINTSLKCTNQLVLPIGYRRLHPGGKTTGE
jgi:hypothetical protein